MLCPMCRERPLPGAASTCSDRCRQRLARKRRRDRQAQAADLLRRQAQALATGDAQEAELLRRQVERLLGASV